MAKEAFPLIYLNSSEACAGFVALAYVQTIKIFLRGEFDEKIVTINFHLKGLNGVDLVVGTLAVLE